MGSTEPGRRPSVQTDEEETMENALWYAAGGEIARCGPFKTQQEAWKAMRLVDSIAARERCPYPKNTQVWPEWDPTLA